MILKKLLASHYCQHALELCQKAWVCRIEKRYQEVAKICSFISTLCIENDDAACERQSKLCAQSVKYLRSGNYSQAEKICDEARRICPKNYEFRGS